jgi:hypothetical protein
MGLGTALLVLGVGATLVATTNGSASLFFVGTAIAGAGFGAAFQGAIRSVLSLAAAHERAGVLSVLYVIAYLAMGVPAVLGGIRFVQCGAVFTTAREYGAAVMALAALAFAGALRGARAPERPTAGYLSAVALPGPAAAEAVGPAVERA